MIITFSAVSVTMLRHTVTTIFIAVSLTIIRHVVISIFIAISVASMLRLLFLL